MSLRRIVTTPDLIAEVLRGGTRAATPDKKKDPPPQDLVVVDVRVSRLNAAPWLEVLVWSSEFKWHAYMGKAPAEDVAPECGKATPQQWDTAPEWRPSFHVTPKRKADDSD